MSIPVFCQSIADRLPPLEQEREGLQEELNLASPREKARLARRIRALNDEISQVQAELAECVASDVDDPTTTSTGFLASGATLAVDDPLMAPGGFAQLTFQGDGNLVLYCLRPRGWVPRWASGTWGQTVTTCVMQTDGNVVLYNDSVPVWSTDTWTFPGAHLAVQDDENVVVYQGVTPVWASHTSLDGTPVKGDGPKVFHLFEGVRHWIPDPETLERSFGGWGRVTVLSELQLSRWPEGDPIESVLDTPDELIEFCFDRVASGPALPTRTEPPRPPRIQSDGSFTGVTRQPLAGETAKMWDVGATLRVSMTGGTPLVRGKVRQYAEAWTQHANIHFAFVDGPAEIRVAFDPGGSWSMVGRDAVWVPFNGVTMNYGWFTDTTSEGEFSRVILHEFGHALGLIHEHQSPAAGIAWDREKVYAEFAKQGWDRAMVEAQIFARYSVTQTNFSAFDPGSIMAYFIPASLTLDGVAVTGGTTLSATDIEWIKRWYPFPPTPQAATGLLRTGDDCDEIDFRVDYGVVAGGNVEFSLELASGLSWWKGIEVPIGGSGYRLFEIGGSASGAVAVADLDVSRPIRFHKAKVFGVHTLLAYTWDVVPALPAGSRLTLLWKRDRC